MAGTMNSCTAQVIALPGAVAEPVVNPRHRGRYPPGVFALSKARMQREWRERAAVRAARNAEPGAGDALIRVRTYESMLSPEYLRDIRIALALARQEAGLPPS